ncbi:MAG TPA: hypothetical protein VKY26_06420 [Actinomycetota bacterium]|nr:hypothetical protein [Actinomycetota bacterium]
MIIDCQACEMQDTDHCADCFVMALLAPRTGPLVLDSEEERAVSTLQEAGLAPPLRFKRRVG